MIVRGLNCRDRTPLLDIKPYFASTDAVPEAREAMRRAGGAQAMRPPEARRP